MKDKTIKFNMNAYFVLPLVGLNTESYGKDAFVNSYITTDGVIILELTGIKELTTPLAKEHLQGAWVNGNKTMAAYLIPSQFMSDFAAFIEGKYSEYSEEAFNLIAKSIPTKVVQDEEVHPESIKWYVERIKGSKHPVSYTFTKGVTFTLTPFYLGAIAPKDHPYRLALLKATENQFGMDLPSDSELYEKPVLIDEFINPLKLKNDESSEQEY